MALGDNGLKGGADVSSLRFEVMRLKGCLDLKHAELTAATAKLKEVEAEAGSRVVRAEAETRSLRGELAETRRVLEKAEKELKELRAAADSRASSPSDSNSADSQTRELLHLGNENRQLRQSVAELSREKAEALSRIRSMDARIMHAAAEAELTRMGQGPTVGSGWSTTGVVLVAVGAAMSGVLLASALRKSH